MEQSPAGFETGDISDHGGIIRRQVEVRENQFHFFTVTGGFQAGTQLSVASTTYSKNFLFYIAKLLFVLLFEFFSVLRIEFLLVV